MMTAVRILGGIVAGLVVAFALVILLELLSSVLHPFQKDVAQTHEEICAHVARYPHWALALLGILGWSATAFASVRLAMRIGNLPAGITVSVILGLLVACNIGMLPYALWFKLACLVVSLPLALPE